MHGTAEFIERLFHLPGTIDADAKRLLSQAASAHAKLILALARDWPSPPLPVRVVRDYLLGTGARSEKQRLLDQPQLIEALHGLAHRSQEVDYWDEGLAQETGRCQGPQLGNVALGLLLREFPEWDGEIDVATDEFGRIHFPDSRYCLSLRRAGALEGDLLDMRTVHVALAGDEATWTVLDLAEHPLLVTDRSLILQLALGERHQGPPGKTHWIDDSIRAAMVHLRELGDSGIEYEPLGVQENNQHHGDVTGQIVLAVLRAMQANSPSIYLELTQYMHVIRGFDLPTLDGGTLASYSSPTAPGRMGFNVSFTANDEPCLSPFCFTWLGHELGHTRHYLIQDVAYLHGWKLVSSPGDRSPVIPRYGRSLPLRTLFQLPYVHLYEWVLHLDFLEAGYHLPWHVHEDPQIAMQEIADEIHDAFDILEGTKEVTPLGRAVLAQIRCLARQVRRRWERSCRAGRGAARTG